MFITENNGSITVSDFGKINLSSTLNCGQCFRWSENNGVWSGVAFGRFTRVRQNGDTLVFVNTPKSDVENIWIHYFDLDRDYNKIISEISKDPIVRNAVEKYGVIRILNQDPSEAFVSFIISACNNIPRIKKIVNTMCESFGEKIDGGFTFPSPEKLASLSADDLAVLHAGYRVPYIMDAAKTVAENNGYFERLSIMSTDDARRELMKIKGVGRKVADCTLLFSMGRHDVFPVDRHIKEAVKKHYPNGLPECFNIDMGLSQQYVFINDLPNV